MCQYEGQGLNSAFLDGDEELLRGIFPLGAFAADTVKSIGILRQASPDGVRGVHPPAANLDK